MEQLAKAANLTAAEVRAIQEDHEHVDIDRIANVFNVHPAVLLMCPDEDPIAQLLERYPGRSSSVSPGNSCREVTSSQDVAQSELTEEPTRLKRDGFFLLLR